MLIEWGSSLPELTEVASKLKETGHDILYWVRNDSYSEVNKSLFPNTIFHDHIKAREGKPALEFKLTKFDPVGSDVMSNFFETESVFLFMIERYYPEKTIQEKKQLFFDLLTYWYGVIVKLKPEVVIFDQIPHHLHTHVVYAVIKFFNIKAIIINSTTLKDKLLITSDVKYNSPDLDSSLKKNLGKNFNLIDLDEELRNVLETQTPLKLNSFQIVNEYHKQKSKKNANTNFLFIKIKYWLKILLSGRFLNLFYRYLKNRLIGNAKKEYLKFQTVPDFSSKFIYVPLHFQPESTTTVLGGIFANQINLIEILSASLPEGWKIYVKEHPVQFYSNGISYNPFRYKGYYERISSIKGVEIIPLNIESSKLIESCQLTATVTGTAAWESTLRLKPAFIFGDIWFQSGPGIFKISNVQKCKEALALIESGFKITKQELINYLFCLQESTVLGNLYLFFKPGSALDTTTNVNNIFKSVIRSMEKT